MIVQGGKLFEAPTTVVAGVRPLVRVVQQVLVERLLERERLGALVARVWCFTCQIRS